MLTYEIFMKHGKKVTDNAAIINPARPVLQGVCHISNGTAAVTDSHRLYVARGIHNRTHGAIITPAGKTLKDIYLDVSRLIPDNTYAKQSLKLMFKIC